MKDSDILEEARERFDMVVEAESESRELQYEDIQFESGDQWPDRIKNARERDPDGPRPCLVVNMARKHKNALLNDIRRNRPSIKVLPVDDKADVETAKILNGLLRHIQAVSDADIATDTAADHQITSGVGYFRLITEKVDDARNEQEIRFCTINNPFSVYMDPYADHPAGADAEWGFVTEEMSRKRFEAMYPDSEAADWSATDQGDARLRLWYPSDETIRVAEYFCIKKREPDDEWSKTKRCYWYRMCGEEILERRELPTSYIPIIRVVGEERRVDNVRDFRGVIRDLRDPQCMYNYWTSANTEYIALAPKAPYLAAAEAIEGHEDDWKEANTANKPYLNYNQFDSATGERLDRPMRSDPIGVNTAIVQSMQQAAEDMRQVSGQAQSAFGERGNETSGRAINARRQEQDNNTFHFVDNLARSIKHAGRVIIEMIPHVYDTRRVVRILGEDDGPEFAQFDPKSPRAMVESEDVTGAIQRIYNPSIGRYDVRVTVGPSYATKAEEGAERLSQIIQSAPDLLAITGDILFKNMDIPGGEDLADRMKAMLPPQIRELEAAKKSGQQQGMQQAEMVRQQMMQQIAPMIEELKMALDQAAQENDQLKGAAQQLKQALDDKQQEMQIKVAELEVKRYEADTKLKAEMADAEAEVAVAYIAAQGGEGGSAQVNGESNNTAATVAAAISTQAAEKSAGEISQRLQQQFTQQLQQVLEVAQAAMQASHDMQQAHQAIEEKTDAVAARLESNEQQRQHMAQIAAGLLTGKISDAQAAAAIGGNGRLN